MIEKQNPEFPFTEEYLIEVPATSDRYRVGERLPLFQPENISKKDVFWGGIPTSWDYNFMTHFGDMIIEPLQSFTIRARRIFRDEELKHVMMHHCSGTLNLAQVLALSQEALRNPEMMRILGDKLNLFWVPDQNGQLLAVSGLFEPRYVLLSVGPTNMGEHHSQNFIITPS